MAVALRCAARRLGGSLQLQQTQAPLMPSRFMSSRQLSGEVSTEQARAHFTRRVQQKKEELYDAVSKAEQKKQELFDVLCEEEQAAVVEEGRRLVSSKHARAHSRCQIQQKEEELYDAFSKANEQHLSAQAAEKTPFDIMRFRKYTQMARGVLDLACKATFFVYGGAFLYGITGADRMLGFPRKVYEVKRED
uniref:Transmembrane protein n=1 Tax=Hordeum vulgare subsp. vulgare TaxID=112509 RepID=A0A8I6X002_HORVV